MCLMSTRIAKLAARLDALSRGSPPAVDDLLIVRRGEELVIPLPPGVVTALALRPGDRIAFQIPAQRSLTVEIHSPAHSEPVPPPV